MVKYLIIIFICIIGLSSVYSQDVTFYSPQYFEQPKNEYSALRFLENEDIIFKVCQKSSSKEIPITDAKGKLQCDTGIYTQEIDLISSEEPYCVIGQVKEINCDEAQLQIEYKANGESFSYERDLIKTKESNAIVSVLSKEYESISNPIELSYYLIVHNNIKGMDEDSEKVYDKLRDLRDNDDKCWPKNSCTIEATTEILHNLKVAGYSQDSRLLEDGEIYLNSNIITDSSQRGNVEVEFIIEDDSSTTCELYVDDELEQEKTFDESRNFSSESFYESFNISCDRNIDEIIIIIEDPISGDLNVTLKDKQEYDYAMEEHYCYGESSCSPISSLKALLTYENSLVYYSQVLEYVQALKKEEEDNQYYIYSSSNPIYSSIYLGVKNDKEVGNFVKFSQNNDGSWGSSSNSANKILRTYWGAKGLDFVEDSSEHITDAQNWMYFEEPLTGWSSLKENALAYLTIQKFIRPFLVLEYDQELNGTHMFTLYNPSIFTIKGVELEFDLELDDFVDYSKTIAQIDAKETVRINVTSKNNVLSKKGGEFKVYAVIDDKREELIVAPVVIKSKELLHISNTEYFYSVDFPSVDVNVENLGDIELECELRSSELNEKSKVTLKKGNNKITLKNSIFFSGNTTLDFVCNNGNNKDSYSYSKEIMLSLQEVTFDVVEYDEMQVIEDFSNEKIVIKSTSKTTQQIELSFENIFKGIVFFEERSFVLRPEDEVTIYFQKPELELLESLSSSNDSLIITSSLGYAKKYPFVYEFEESSSLSWLYSIIVIFFLALVGLVGYQWYQNKVQSKKQNGDAKEEGESEEEFDFEELELK